MGASNVLSLSLARPDAMAFLHLRNPVRAPADMTRTAEAPDCQNGGGKTTAEDQDDFRERKKRRAIAYLDLWERNICYSVVHGGPQSLSGKPRR
jgi:hypothetical protein